MHETLKPLAGHAVLVLLLQLTALLVVARLGAELSKRLGLPAVVGELAAGITLGPTVLGHLAPTISAFVFPHEQEQNHLLDVLANLGMVLLLLLTGLETDLKLLKNLGRAALIASGAGMAVPFVAGFLLGELMPESYLAQPEHRVIFSMFLATAMAISAMPVIAKILLDLDLTRRNMGLVILSAGVVDDTAGWLILSLIAGAATQGQVRVGGLLLTLVLTVVFIAGCAFVLYPLLRLFIRWSSTRFKTPDTDLVVIVSVTFLCAAITEKIGIHAVFGAFIAGTVLKQVPLLSPATVHKLEAFVFSVLGPVFFGMVGLQVDLWQLAGGGGTMFLVVLGVACFGKLVGCTVGGLWGGLHFWESLSIAVAMNARGAMGLVAAVIGLGLGILNSQMFSIIVMMAIVTSFMAPLGLRLTMRMVRVSEEEAQRILAEQSKGSFDPEKLRVLVPTAGGPHALGAARVALALTERSDSPVEIVYVDTASRWWERPLRFLRANPDTHSIDEHLAEMQRAANGGRPPSVRRARAKDAVLMIVEEAQKGFDLILLGASLRVGSRGPVIGGPVIENVVESAPCHVAIVKGGARNPPYKRILVPIDGRVATRVAAELALRYAENAGAELTLATVAERPQQQSIYDLELGEMTRASIFEQITDAQALERVSKAFVASKIKPHVLRLDFKPSGSPMIDEAASGRYDAVFLGAENRAVQHRLFFGRDNERMIRLPNVAAIVVVPSIARLK